MSIDRDCWREGHKSHVKKEDVLYVLKEIISLLEEIPVSDDKSGAINELPVEACENLEIAHSMMGGEE